MKYVYLVIPALLLSLASCFAQSATTDSIAGSTELLHIEQQLLNGIAAGDTLLWGKYLAPDFMIVSEDGSRSTRAAYLHDLKPLPAGVSGHINITAPHFHFTGNVAVLNYVADEYENYFGQSLHTTYAYMSVYQKKNDWQIINIQIFEIPQLPVSITLPEELLEQYAGIYHLAADITYTVTLEEHQLYGQRTGRNKEALWPETASVFFRKSDTRGRKLFLRKQDGGWEMHERRNGQDVVWAKQQ